MEKNRSFAFEPSFVFGISIIAVGIVFMLDNMGIIYAGDFFRYWPALLIIFGITKVSQSSKNSGQIFGWILILIGALKLLDVFNFINFRIWDWWPIVFIIIGLNFLRGSWNRKRNYSQNPFQEVSVDSDSYVKITTLMSGVKRIITSKEFQGGEISSIMGGCEIDLRGAEMKGNEAVIDVNIIMGGIEIRVPMGWTVSVDATPIMGGVEDSTYPPKEGELKKLIITGTIIMGGVEIKN